MAVLKRLGYDVNQLNGAKVHSLYNVMTMQSDVHDWFDRLEIWFEKTVRITLLLYLVVLLIPLPLRTPQIVTKYKIFIPSTDGDCRRR